MTCKHEFKLVSTQQNCFGIIYVILFCEKCGKVIKVRPKTEFQQGKSESLLLRNAEKKALAKTDIQKSVLRQGIDIGRKQTLEEVLKEWKRGRLRMEFDLWLRRKLKEANK